MNQQKTGELLKRLRKEKRLTQDQLAEKFYVSSRTVSRWETGSNMPDVAILIELADLYDWTSVKSSTEKGKARVWIRIKRKLY